MLHLLASALLLFGCVPTQAKLFKNAYISFDIQDNWDCTQNQTEWVCRSKDPKEFREAVILLTAKERGPTDSFDLYQNHMNSPHTTRAKNGGGLTSRVVYKSQQNRYNDQMWLDGLQSDSEVKNYFTRYLATIKEPIAILVTFSAHNTVYAKYSGLFTNAIRSLRVIAAKDILSDPNIRLKDHEFFGQNPGAGGLPDLLQDADGDNGKNKSASNEKLMGFGILALAVLLYIAYRIYAKKKD